MKRLFHELQYPAIYVMWKKCRHLRTLLALKGLPTYNLQRQYIFIVQYSEHVLCNIFSHFIHKPGHFLYLTFNYLLLLVDKRPISTDIWNRLHWERLYDMLFHLFTFYFDVNCVLIIVIEEEHEYKIKRMNCVFSYTSEKNSVSFSDNSQHCSRPRFHFHE